MANIAVCEMHTLEGSIYVYQTEFRDVIIERRQKDKVDSVYVENERLAMLASFLAEYMSPPQRAYLKKVLEMADDRS